MDAGPRAEAPRRRVGDRLEQAIEHHADVAAELARGEQELEREPAKGGGSVRRTVFWLVVSAVSLYLVAPSVVEAFGSWRQIERLSPAWLAVMAVLQVAALACLWIVQWLSLQRRALAAGDRLAARRQRAGQDRAGRRRDGVARCSTGCWSRPGMPRRTARVAG